MGSTSHLDPKNPLTGPPRKVVVVGPSGRKLQSQVLETNAKGLIDFLNTIPKDRHLCLEEGTHANWLHEVLSPHVQEIVVAGVRQSRGPKSDKRGAFKLAEELRVGSLVRRVYKGSRTFASLRALGQAYANLVTDSARMQNRVKSLYRSRGVAASGQKVFARATREALLQELPGRLRPRASTLYQELDAVNEVKKGAAKAMEVLSGVVSPWGRPPVLEASRGVPRARVAALLPHLGWAARLHY